MENETQNSMQLDSYTRFCLGAITVLLTVLVIGLWMERIGPTDQARAGTFKDEKSRKAFEEGRWGTSSASGKVAAEQERTNTKLDEMIRVLKSGEVQVQIVGGTAADQGGSSASKNSSD